MCNQEFESLYDNQGFFFPQLIVWLFFWLTGRKETGGGGVSYLVYSLKPITLPENK